MGTKEKGKIHRIQITETENGNGTYTNTMRLGDDFLDPEPSSSDGPSVFPRIPYRVDHIF